MISIPEKPFPGYKWRWATVTCTESLNEPPVLLGVLRAMEQFEGRAPSDPDFNEALKVVQLNTHARVKLAKSDPTRNLIRNSGQYWKAVGLIEDSTGRIQLTTFGKQVATGEIGPVEFAATVIKTLELPNRRIDADWRSWDAANLTLKPLELILSILVDLNKTRGEDEAYITPDELAKIVIPLAGANAPLGDYLEALTLFRRHQLSLEGWPDCAPRANDLRMAREFLLFLHNYGFCRLIPGSTNKEDRYVLCEGQVSGISDLLTFKLGLESSAAVTTRLRQGGISGTVERQRYLAEVTARPQQQAFRKNVLAAFGSSCLVTGVSMATVVEAAHIVPVSSKGSDAVSNGLCLRADIHLLFDSGHLRITQNGEISLSALARCAENYRVLPRRVTLPDFVSREALHWRWRYL